MGALHVRPQYQILSRDKKRDKRRETARGSEREKEWGSAEAEADMLYLSRFRAATHAGSRRDLSYPLALAFSAPQCHSNAHSISISIWKLTWLCGWYMKICQN